MAHTPEPRGRTHRRSTWAAFLAGAVTVLAIVLAWLACRRTDDVVRGAIRADIALPSGPPPPLPNAPPPEGPHLPRPPLPIPK